MSKIGLPFEKIQLMTEGTDLGDTDLGDTDLRGLIRIPSGQAYLGDKMYVDKDGKIVLVKRTNLAIAEKFVAFTNAHAALAAPAAPAAITQFKYLY